MKAAPILFVLCFSLIACNSDFKTFNNPTNTDATLDQSIVSPNDFKIIGYDWRYEQPICGEAEFTITRTIPDMVILLDRSNSMSYTSPNNPTLWDSCRSAIYDITAAMDSQIWFGLFVFPSPDCFYILDIGYNECSAPAAASPLVPVGGSKSGNIKSTLTPMPTCGGTPTRATLHAAGEYLKTLTTQHPQYILLATDGGPNCNESLTGTTCICTAIPNNCDINSGNCLDDTATYNELDALCKAGIKTYVIGLGTDTNLTNVLNEMAKKGCTAQPYNPVQPADIKKAFQSIATAVATCSFDVDCKKIQDVNKVNFYFDGKVVPLTKSHQGGWDWVTQCKGDGGMGKVEFFGSDCTAIKDATVKVITAKFGCDTKIS